MLNKRIISLLAAIGILISCIEIPVGVAADDNDSVVNDRVKMFAAFGILPNDGRKSAETVKRDEFAYYISCIMRKSAEQVEQGTGADSSASDKYTGYTNDVVREEWVWEGEKTETDEKTETIITETNTPFYDLRTTDEYYSSIEYVYNMGIMRGSDGYFRPKERLTGYEMLKVMVTLLGAGRYAGDDYPGGYIAAAEKTGLMKELKIGSLDGFVTYGDYVNCVNALLNSHSFKFRNGNLSELVISDNIFREDYLNIYKERGIMTTNGTATISDIKAENGYISVGDVYIKEETGSYDELLGFKVDAYYTDDDEKEIKYMCAAESNREKVISAEDIIGYKHPYYSYYEGNTSKQVYCGTDTTVMYNGFISESYTEEDMVPKTGSVRLIDNNSDGKYEVAFVENYTTYWVNVNDTVNKKIYDELNKKSISLDEFDNVIVRDKNSAAMEVADIKRNAVLFVAPTKSTQKDSCVTIIVSTDTETAKVKSIKKDKISTADAEYELSKESKTNDIVIGETYTFYLDPNGRIVTWEKKAAEELVYGYLVKVSQNTDSLDKITSARIYVIADEDLSNFEFADKVNVNDKKDKVKSEDLLGCGELYDSTTKTTVSQAIRYKLNADKKISDIYTPNAVKDKLVTVYKPESESKSFVFRESPNAFMDTQPMFYGTSGTVWLNVPKDASDDKDSYYIKKYKHDDYVYVSEAYGSDENSMEASLIVYKTDSAKSKTVGNAGAAVLLIKDISNISMDDDIYKAFTCYTPNGEKEYYLEEGSGLADTSEYRIGDLIRLEASENTNKIKSIERVFDCDKMLLENETGLYKNGTANPQSSESTMHFVAATFIFHGAAEKTYNNGNILNVRLFKYAKDSEGNTKKDGFKDSTEDFNIKSSMYNTYIIDKERDVIYKTTANDAIVTAEASPDGKGTEMVVSNFWGSPRAIFIYK